MTVNVSGLSIDDGIYKQITETAASVGINAKGLLENFAGIVHDLAPKNDRLLEDRDRLQRQIDKELLGRKDAGNPLSPTEYEAFLKEIGYIVPAGGNVTVTTQKVDPEFTIGAPQLVCPIFIGDNPETNARYPLNAVNARWSSLYDAMYGKPGDRNVISEQEGKGFTNGYNVKRGDAVINYVNNNLLDKAVPLNGAKHEDVTRYEVKSGKLLAKLEDSREVELKHPEKFIGYNNKEDGTLASVLLKNNGLHIELQIDHKDQIGATNKSGVKDVVVESALTTIIDMEDATSAVDAKDKILGYRNLVGLMNGNLTADIPKNGGVKRTLDKDRTYTAPNGSFLTLPGRSMMMFRRVGMHMHTDAIKLGGRDIPEGFLDTLMIALASMKDLKKKPGELRNSKTGSIYIVMPKQHGPEEVKLTVELFSQIEKALQLETNTLKIGIMDEEQRTSVNLKECIRAAQDRIVFINTGFLDRTGDLIHTDRMAGPMNTKAEIKKAPWLDAYERSNMQVGLETGLHTRGQIGKGMWAENRNPAGLISTKGGQLKAGATTAWVPDPKGGALHAMHYHQIDVGQVKQDLLSAGNEPVEKYRILEMPLLPGELSAEEKQELTYGYCQSILGYVARWVDQGVGCSSVPDHTNTSLMEDRATLRIGSQLLSNWLHHGVINSNELNVAMARAAEKVDEQNKGDSAYIPLVGNYSGPAFQAAMELIQEGINLPNGYVEPVLHAARREVKARGSYRGGNDVRYIPRIPTSSPSSAQSHAVSGNAQKRYRA